MRAGVLVVSKVDIIMADSDLITAVNMSLATRFVGNAQPLTMKLLKYLVIHSTLYNCYFSCPGQSHTARTSDKIKCACNEEITLAGELNTRPGIFRGAEVKKCQFKCPFHFLDAFVTSTDICLEHLVFIVSITRGCIFASAGQRTERFQFLESYPLFTIGNLAKRFHRSAQLSCGSSSTELQIYFVLFQKTTGAEVKMMFEQIAIARHSSASSICRNNCLSSGTIWLMLRLVNASSSDLLFS